MRQKNATPIAFARHSVQCCRFTFRVPDPGRAGQQQHDYARRRSPLLSFQVPACLAPLIVYFFFGGGICISSQWAQAGCFIEGKASFSRSSGPSPSFLYFSSPVKWYKTAFSSAKSR